MMKPILKVISQGCAANFGEGEKIARILQDNYQISFGQPQRKTDPQSIEVVTEIDTYVLNVCTVKGNATAIKLIREAKEISPNAKIIITGCAPKDLREQVTKQFDGIQFSSLKEIEKTFANEASLQHASNKLRESETTGIVNIEEGCLDACAYCSTHLVKGRLKSFKADWIVRQVEQLVGDGCKEIQLTGQDCGCYGFDIGTNLAELVKQILVKVPGDYKLRLGMGNPRHVLKYRESLIECFYDSHVYKFLHLPVQSGSENVLKAMNRRHTVKDFMDLAAEFNNRFNLFTLSTDLIVGFPGETETDFEDTLNVLRETRPTVCNITRFVSRPGTPAEKLTQIVPDAIKHKRSSILSETFQQIAVENNRYWIGQNEDVVLEKEGYHKGSFIARNDAYRPVAITFSPSATVPPRGTKLSVQITDAEAFALIGTLKN